MSARAEDRGGEQGSAVIKFNNNDLSGMKYCAVHATLVAVQLVNKIALFAPVASRVINISRGICTSRCCHKHLVPNDAALDER
jgi:hypothetical protein